MRTKALTRAGVKSLSTRGRTQSIPTRAVRPTRLLTISSTRRDRYDDGFWAGTQVVPVLRLLGLWLGQAGFSPGQRVSVQVEAGRIVITPAPPGAGWPEGVWPG